MSAFLKFIYVFIFFGSLQSVHSQLIDILYDREICDTHEFYRPYVKVSKTRRGPVIKGLYETGYLDTSEYSGLLCINGPAFLYSDDEKVEPQVFSHGCFAFNRRNMKDYQSGHLPPLNKNTVVYGYKIYGVFLLADPLDVRRSQFHWFRKPNFRHRPGANVIVEGSSFGMILNDGGKSGSDIFEVPPGPTKYCFEIDSLNIFGKVSGIIRSKEKPKFCFHPGDDSPPDEFFEVFQKRLPSPEYKWLECPDPDPDGTSTEIDNSPPDNMPDFRIIDPKLMRPVGSPGKPFKGKSVVKDTASIPFYSRPYPPGYFFKGEPGYVESVTFPPDASSEATTKKPVKLIKTDLIICEELPELQDPCSDDPDEEKSCDLLKHVLTIEEVKWTDDAYKLMAASWRKEIMVLVSRIYQKICPQISKGLAPAVTRVVEYFLWKVATASKTVEGTDTGGIKFKSLNAPKREEWDNHLIPDLKTCLDHAQKMPFYRTKDLVNEARKKEMEEKLEKYGHDPNSTVNLQELEDLIRDVHIQFPYHIWLPPPTAWNNSTQIKIREHIEAAEIDYNLDWAIDTFWKVFSSVLGYCNKHYSIRNGDTFKKLYSFYTEDILDLVIEQWSQNSEADGTEYIFGNFEKAYDQLFGEFVNGISTRYIDACNDGSYWHADVPDYLPFRPLILKDGALSSGSSRPVNFFLEHPLFPSD